MQDRKSCSNTTDEWVISCTFLWKTNQPDFIVVVSQHHFVIKVLDYFMVEK